MRFALFLIASVSFCLAKAPSVRAQSFGQSNVALRTEVYADTDRTTVYRPRVSGRSSAGPISFGASWMADVVSSASVDVLTRATQGFDEVHQDVGFQVGWQGKRGVEGGVFYLLGIEPDYRSHGVGLQSAMDLDRNRQWRLNATLAFSHARIEAVIDPRFRASNYALQASVGLTHILDGSNLLRIGIEAARIDGLQSSPYRNVRLGNWNADRYRGDDPESLPWVFQGVTGSARETHPKERWRGRLGLEALHDFGVPLALLARVGAYRDSWKVSAIDLGAELRWQPLSWLLLRSGVRSYVQSRAFFWRARYVDRTDVQGYVSDDKELGRLLSHTLYGAAAFSRGAFRWDLRLEGIRYDYLDFTLLPHKYALIAQAGMAWIL